MVSELSQIVGCPGGVQIFLGDGVGGEKGILLHIIVGYRISVDAKILIKTLAKNSAIYTKNYAP